MIISAIVAVAANNVIGYQDELPWYLPADLQFFKKTTLHHPVIMGRKCFESIGNPLPKRTNIIVTRNPYYAASGCIVAHSIAEALQLAQQQGAAETFIIGGGMIYEASMPYWDKLYWTDVNVSPEGDVFFPTMDWSVWALASEECHRADAKNEHDYCFRIFNKRTT